MTSWVSSGVRATTVSASNARPTTEARCAVRRSFPGKRSIRAASSAWMVAGTWNVGPPAVPSSELVCPSSASIRTISSTKSGLPSAAARMRVRRPGGTAEPPGSASIRAEAASPGRPSRTMAVPVLPSRASRETAQAGQGASGRRGAAARPGRRRGCAPGVRGAWALPNGYPRPARPEGGTWRGVRACGERPRRYSSRSDGSSLSPIALARRRARRGPSLASARSVASLAWPSIRESVSTMPAAAWTTWVMGRNVIPHRRAGSSRAGQSRSRLPGRRMQQRAGSCQRLPPRPGR